MDSFIVIVAALLGAAIGSFLNVVIWRVPRKESLSYPASHCPKCDHPIRRRDNIPILSWVLLRGKCRDCGEPISGRYPAVEAVTAVAFGAVTWWFLQDRSMSSEALLSGNASAVTAAIVGLVALLYLVAISVALVLIDIDTHTLPNRIVLPSYVVAALLLSVSSLLAGDPEALLRGAIGMAGLFGFYFLLVLVYPGGMGFGDVKLAGVLGLYLAWTGWGELAVGAFAAFVLGGLFSIVLVLRGRAGRKTRIPFGPWMIIGAWVGIVVGGEIASWYLGLFGLN